MIRHKPKILVLADDLTGAAEIGGIAFHYGLEVRIRFDLKKYETAKENVTIIDTASRSFDPQHASRAMVELISGYDLAAFDLIYKKVDSVLRGPVIAEASAFITKTGFNRVLMIPANPSRNRIIRDGRYFIDGVPINETAFRLDPLHPRLSATVQGLLNGDEVLVTGKDVNLSEEGKIFVPDIGSEDDITRLLKNLALSRVLMAGGYDLFRILLSNVMHLRPSRDRVSPELSENHHFIIGSSSDNSIQSVNRLSELGYAICELPVPAIRDESLFREWTQRIANYVKSGRKVVVTGPLKIIKDTLDAVPIAGKVAEAATIIPQHSGRGTHLFLVGGETASSFFRKMGCHHLTVRQIHDIGIVSLRPDAARIQVTVKPGSYPWPEKLFE